MTISEQIKVLCVRQKISLAELARRLGTTPQNFNAKLKRESFTVAELEDIAEAAGVTLKEVLCWMMETQYKKVIYMADVLTKEQRHKNMKNIHGKDTKIEIILRKALWAKGYRYRKNYKKLPGNPDIVLTKYKIAIFCDGEFFHGKDWEVLKPRLEKSNNSEFWISKISRNRERDDEVNKRLLFEGWTVIRFWGDDIKKHTDECVKVVEEAIFDLNFDESEDFN